MDYLSKIQTPRDLQKLSFEELDLLAEQIRHFLVENVSVTGGHLASNLGVVELTIALHRVFNLPEDKLIFDVGHQSYVHKILTGRREGFAHLRQRDGLSGFPKVRESTYDAFDTGHASTSISAAYGLCKARDLQGQKHEVIAVIGDGSLTGGMAYEAMNNAGRDKSKLIVVLNDNEMAISKNVGSLSQHLNRLRTQKGYLRSKMLVKQSVARHPKLTPLYETADKVKNRVKYMLVQGILFEEMGFTYLGPVDGHDIRALTKTFNEARKLNEPVLVHVTTVKGKGYAPAQLKPEEYHGISCSHSSAKSWAGVFGESLEEICKKDPAVVAVTAAMLDGVGLKDTSIPASRIFDVGIAEEHAVTFAAGMSQGGLKPCVAIYSTFLQRAYDQIIHDVCLTGKNVVFAVDHSGVVGEDGETHQGIFDTSYLSHIPGLTLMAPADEEEMKQMLPYAFGLNRPVAVKYPKGTCPRVTEWEKRPELVHGKSALALEEGEGIPVAILSVGDRLGEALKAGHEIARDGARVRVYDVRFIAPMDRDLILELLHSQKLILTVEEQVYTGSFGMQVSAIAGEEEGVCRVLPITLPDEFITQDSRGAILKELGLDAEGIVNVWKKAKETIK